MARGSSDGGTSEGASAVDAGLKKARAPPNTTAMAKIGQKEASPATVMTARAATQTNSALMQMTMIVRRWCRSAVSPAIRDRANRGRNCASPIRPS